MGLVGASPIGLSLFFFARFQHVADNQPMSPSCLFQVGLFVDFFVRLFVKIKFSLVGDCILSDASADVCISNSMTPMFSDAPVF